MIHAAGARPAVARVAAQRVAGVRAAATCALAACALAVFGLALPGGASADVFGPISLVSVGSVNGGAPQQVDYAHDAAISGNGRYVAFDGSVAGRTGVWRRDLATGAIEQVAPGDAELPSISESGRYISFTTTEALEPEDGTRGPNVWVRDMEPAPSEPNYELVSAADGSDQGLKYAYPLNPPLEQQRFGAVAVGRSAISADGRRVAFVTSAISNLVRYPQLEAEEEERGETPKPHTPAWQVAVRDLSTLQTTLVSSEYEPGAGTNAPDKPVSSTSGEQVVGAAYAGASPGFRAPPAYAEWAGDPQPGASISADGSTVAWLGVNVGKQARMLPAELPAPLYTEPLWRRIEAGSQTATTRVTGGSEPENPECAAHPDGFITKNTPPSDPCLGPFVVEPSEAATHATGIWPTENNAVEVGDFVPRLSGDGYEVAFLSGAAPVALGENFGFGADPRGQPSDAYVADMHAGLTRRAAVRPLTELAGARGIAQIDPIDDIEISRDGTQVAFTTRRTVFGLSSPAFVSAPAVEPGLSELFDANLADATLTRVSNGYEGGPSEQPHEVKKSGEEDVYGSRYGAGSQSPSFSADGALIAFSSTASNLAFGDGNTPPAGPLDGGDAFLVARQVLGTVPTAQTITPAPSTTTEPVWTLGATAVSRRDGSVLLYVQVPGAGTLRADANSALALAPAGSSRSARRRGSRSARAHVRIAMRTVASARRPIAGSGGGELVTLLLKPASHYAPLASRNGGLPAGVKVLFAAAGHPTLRQTLEVVFHNAAHLSRKGRRASSHRKAKR